MSTADRLFASRAVRLVALFGPEHGIRGTAADGARISSRVDRKTGLPIGAPLLDLVRRMHPNDFRWQERGAGIDRLAGTNALRQSLERNQLPELLARWDRDAKVFEAMRRAFLLY